MTAPTSTPMPVPVDAPPIERYLYGLLSAAQILTPPDNRWEVHGVNYAADSCGPGGGIFPNPCDTLQPGQATVYTITVTKPVGSDTLLATLTANAYGPTVPVTVTVGTDPPQTLLEGQTSAPFAVTANSIVPVTGAIPATGVFPACSETANVSIPSTANSATSSFGCVATIPFVEGPTKVTSYGLSIIDGQPFLVYESQSCLSMSIDEASTHAGNKLALHEQFWVERTFDTIMRQNVTVLNGGTAVGMVRGLGLLEDAIAEQYGGIGVIHAARELGALYTHLQVVRRDGPRLRSPLDNLYAFGAGYSTVGPTGTAAPAGQAWIYATGPVVARRSEVQVREAFDQRKNLRLAVAERSYVLTADCLRLGVLVTLPEA